MRTICASVSDILPKANVVRMAQFANHSKKFKRLQMRVVELRL